MKNNFNSYVLPLLVLAAITLSFNQYLILSMSIKTAHAQMKLSGDLGQDAVTMAVYTGVPEIYGNELGVTYDATQEAMNVMKQFDPGYGSNKIMLEGEMLKRYIDVTTRISCEFCCGAKAISFADGRAACGCAHSQAMRGLAAYLLQYHPAEYDNDRLMKELAVWKGRYFPKQMIKKVTDQIISGQFTPDIASLLIGVDTTQYSGKGAPLPSEIQDLPDMVGGC